MSHSPAKGSMDSRYEESMKKNEVSHEDIVDIEEHKTPEEIEADRRLERRLKWKLDLTILPLLALVYFLSQMGRSDLANAKVAGMSKDLRLTPKQYANVASIFQVGYIVLQLPGTLLVRKIGPSLQFSCAMMGVGSLHDGLRFLVGTAEAFVQGTVFYLSFWYTYTELATRGAIFWSTSALAGSFNGLIAYGIVLNLDGDKGWSAWRWLFLIEGALPIFCSVIVILLLPATPEKAHFLFSNAERELAVKRSRATHNAVDAKLRPKLIYKPLVDPKFWLLVLMNACVHFGVSSLSNFLPDIIHGFGYIALRAQLMTVIVYACALVGIIFWARVADKTNCRGFPIVACSVLSSAGYIMLLTITNYKGRLAATCITALGIYPCMTLILTWSATNLAGYTKRGASVALINMAAQAFSISGNQAYVDPPYYRIGNAAALSLVALMGVTALLMMLLVKRLNAKKAKLRSELSAEQLERFRGESLDIVGDDHIDFDYHY